MRRTIFLALLAALLIAPAARATPPIEIQRDCADDGVLQGDYSTSDLRKARSDLPTDADEYSDCRDVLSRAISAATAKDSGGGGGSTGGGTDTGGATPSATASPTGSTPSQPDAADLSDTSSESGSLPAPYTPADHQAVAKAAADGGKPIDLNGHKVAPGTHLVAEVGRNDIPGTLLVVLALAGGALIALVAPAARRRVIARRQP